MLHLCDIVLRIEPRNENTIYWDGGKKKIMAWKAQHLPSGTSASTASPVDSDNNSLCQYNRICNVLGLRTLEMEEFDGESSPPKSMARKPNLEFLVHEKDVNPRS